MSVSTNNVLRRSHKTEFNTTNMSSADGLSRERSFAKAGNLQKRRSQTTMTNMKSSNKPTMEIYRPPNVRSDLLPNNATLNVHAKEFTMTPHQLQTSKSSGNIGYKHVPSVLPSTSTILVPRTNFQRPDYTTSQQSIKRSKSMIETNRKAMDIDLGSFPEEERAHLKSALHDPNSLASRQLMDLVKIILDRVVEGIKYTEAGAKLCIQIIEKERTQTFIETLVNTCQEWYQKRDVILRGIKAGDGTRFTAFMWFLTEMCGQLKRHQMMHLEGEMLQPVVVLLSVLSKCCMACVSLPIRCLAETECLFFVLTSIGRDLENELPAQLELLMASVRDGFLASAGSSSVRRTLLQLIELHASKWQLPGSSVLYYYPRVK